MSWNRRFQTNLSHPQSYLTKERFRTSWLGKENTEKHIKSNRKPIKWSKKSKPNSIKSGNKRLTLQ